MIQRSFMGPCGRFGHGVGNEGFEGNISRVGVRKGKTQLKGESINRGGVVYEIILYYRVGRVRVRRKGMNECVRRGFRCAMDSFTLAVSIPLRLVQPTYWMCSSSPSFCRSNILGINGEILPELSETWGAPTRICIQLARSPCDVEVYRTEVESATSDFVQIFDLAGDTEAGVVSHVLFAARPKDNETLPDRTAIVTTITSKHVGRLS